MHDQRNRKQRENHELTLNRAEFPVLLVGDLDAVAVAVDHHHERLVETIHSLVL